MELMRKLHVLDTSDRLDAILHMSLPTGVNG